MAPFPLTKSDARRIWLAAQRLDEAAPFGAGPRVRQWTWIGKGPRRARRALIEEALHRFERFQLAR